MKAFRSRVRRFARRYRRVCAAVLAGLAVWAALSVLRPPGPATTTALVTVRSLPGGQAVTADDVAVRQLPLDAVPTDFLHDPGQAVGRPLTVPVPAGAVLLPGSVVNREALAGPGLSVLPVTLASTAVGLIEVGDRIDLLGADAESDAVLLASAARVVAVLSRPGGSSPLSPMQSSGPVLLVEVRPASLPRVAAAAARGPLGFGLR